MADIPDNPVAVAKLEQVTAAYRRPLGKRYVNALFQHLTDQPLKFPTGGRPGHLGYKYLHKSISLSILEDCGYG